MTPAEIKLMDKREIVRIGEYFLNLAELLNTPDEVFNEKHKRMMEERKQRRNRNEGNYKQGH